MAVLGQATRALVPPNPFTSKLARDCEKPIAHFATQMALLCSEISGKKHQFALGFQAGRCCEKVSSSALARVFSQQIQHSHSESTLVFLVFLFDSFAPAHLALRANLRLLYRAPAPALGCVYLGNPQLKNDPFGPCLPAALVSPHLRLRARKMPECRTFLCPCAQPAAFPRYE